MFSHLLISFIVVIGGLIFGYRYIISKFHNCHPQINKSLVKSVLGLPMLQFGIWALAFIPLWAFMPTHPKYDGGTAFWNSDLANWEIFRELGNQAEELYGTMYLLGVGFLIFGGIAVAVVYSLAYNRIFSNSTIKTLCTTDTVFSTLAAWELIGLPLIPIVGFLFSWIGSVDVRIAFIIIAEVIWAVWVVRKAIILQKNFNKSLAVFDDGTLFSLSHTVESTKKCPYCGETIMVVAKKCKHCGEWIKEEDLVVEVIKPSISAPRNAFREKVMAERAATSNNKGSHGKSWLWWIIGIVVVAIACVMIFSNKSDSDEEPFDPAWYQGPQESEPSESDFIID